jgi:hypothetical protein
MVGVKSHYSHDPSRRVHAMLEQDAPWQIGHGRLWHRQGMGGCGSGKRVRAGVGHTKTV